MKKLLMLLITATLFVACKKQTEDIIEPLPKPVLTKSTSFTDKNVIAGIPVKNAEFQYSVPNVQNFEAGVDITLSGTLNPSNIQGLSFTIKKKSDTSFVVYQSPVKNTVTAFNRFADWIPLLQNPAYVISVNLTPKAGSIGTIITTLAVEAQWGTNGYDMSSVVGQKTTVTPYPRSPSLTYVEVTGSIDTSITKKKYSMQIDGDTTMIKQVAYDIQYSNPTNDTGATQLKIYKNGSDITSRGIFTNASGTIITILRKSDTKVFFTFTTGGGEDTAVGLNTYDIYWKDKTFEPYGVEFLTDPDLPTGFYYVNAGTTGSNAKLYSSKTTSSSAQVFNFIWSFFSHPHSGLTPFSTNDWRNGKGFGPFTQRVWH